jgi:hypothetical protein
MIDRFYLKQIGSCTALISSQGCFRSLLLSHLFFLVLFFFPTLHRSVLGNSLRIHCPLIVDVRCRGGCGFRFVRWSWDHSEKPWSPLLAGFFSSLATLSRSVSSASLCKFKASSVPVHALLVRFWFLKSTCQSVPLTCVYIYVAASG